MGEPTTTDPANRSALRAVLSGTSWETVGQFVPIGVNIVLTPYIIHHLGIDRWGLIALITTIEQFLNTFDGGLTEATNRFFAVYAGRDDRALTTRTLTSVLCLIVVTGSAAAGAGWFVAPFVVSFFRMPGYLRPETVFCLRTVLPLIALSYARNTFAAVVYARQRYAFANIVGMATYGVWVAGLLLTVDYHLGLRGVAVTFLAQQILATASIVPFALRFLDRRSMGLLPKSGFKELLSFSGRVQIAGLARLVNAEVDGLIIGMALSVHSLAMYNSGSGFAGEISGMLSNANTPLSTHLSRSFGAGGEAQARRTFEKVQGPWVLLCNAFFVVGIGSAYYAVMDWLGPQFRVAGVLAMVLLAGQAVALSASVLGLYCITIGRAGLYSRIGVVSMAVNLTLTVPLVFTGAVGVVAATSVGLIAASGYLLHYVRRKVAADMPSFVRYFRLIPSLITGGAVFGMEYLVSLHCPRGPLGLLSALGPAVVGLGLFVLLSVGPRRLAKLWHTAAGARSGASPGGLGGRLTAAISDWY
jgi:O-antigen/teichoic acid export membrane protein